MLRGAITALARQFRSRPGWVLTVLLVLALGTGTALAGWVVVDAVLLRSLGVEDEASLVRIGGTGADRQWLNSSSWPAYEVYRGQQSVFADVAAEGQPDPLHWRVPGGDQRVKLEGRAVTGNYFATLGVDAALGRTIAAHDDQAGAPPVVVVSHRFWRQRLGGRPDVLGQLLRINATDYTLVGVLGPEFRGMDLQPLDVWMPARPNLAPAEIWTSTDWHMFEVFGRLRPGATLAQASAAVDAATQAFGGWGGGNDHSVAVPVSRLGNSYRDGDAVRGATVLGVGVLAVLLLTSINAAGLLLVRAERQRGALALRSCIGASRWRLARELAAESGLLVVVGTAAGVLLAVALAHATLAAAGAPGVLGVQDLRAPSLGRAVVAGLAIMAMAALVCLVPLLRVPAGIAATPLRSGIAHAAAGRRWWSGRALVVAQFALSAVVVWAAFTFVSAYAALWGREVGTANLQALVMRLDYSADQEDTAGQDARSARLLAALEAHPAVAAAAIAPMVPVSGASMTIEPTLPGRTDTSSTDGFYNPVSEGFFDALGIPLRAGRRFGPQDRAGAAPVVIVSEATARRLWPDRDPLGQTVEVFGMPATVVGVVADVSYQSLDEPARNLWYVPLTQRMFGGFFHAVVLPRPGQGVGAAAALHAAALQVEPERAPGVIETLAERVDRSVAGPRFVAAVTTVFGGLALLLAAVGCYGAFAFLVSVRRRELGLRMAVGASPQRLAGMVFRDAARLALLGTTAGALLGAGTLRVLSSTFPDLPALSPALATAAVATVAVAGLLAVFRPAVEAAVVDPAEALRCD